MGLIGFKCPSNGFVTVQSTELVYYYSEFGLGLIV